MIARTGKEEFAYRLGSALVDIALAIVCIVFMPTIEEFVRTLEQHGKEVGLGLATYFALRAILSLVTGKSPE
jgi:hypothetical protein